MNDATGPARVLKQATPAPEPATLAIAPPSLAPAHAADGGFDVSTSLPRDHPAWQRDVLAVSARVRAILARMRPVAVRVLTFWDHAVRRVTIGGRRLDVDPSGCYRRR
jgi:hypothetical protein